MKTQIIEALLNKISPEITPNLQHKAVVSCIDKELHEIDVKIVANIFNLTNGKTFYLVPKCRKEN